MKKETVQIIIRKYNKLYWGIILLVYGIIFYSKFIRNVIPPQFGWWHYMAWRMEQGDLPYKDFYLFIPPYFLLLTSMLFKFLGKHLFLYSVLGFLVTRLLMWFLLYKILIRIVRPMYAAIGIMTGLSLTAAFAMDSTYDYNPLITLVIVVIAFLFCLLYDQKQNRRIMWIAWGIGICSGFLLFLKQTVGFLIPPVSLAGIIWICRQKDIRKKYIYSMLSYALGMIVALLPGLGYLLYNNLLDDAYFCLTTAVDAKIVDINIFQLVFRNFIRIDQLICAIAIVSCIILGKKYGVKKEPTLYLLSLFAVFMTLYNIFGGHIKGFKESIGQANFLECIALTMILMFVLYHVDRQIKRSKIFITNEYIIFVMSVIFILMVFCVKKYLTPNVAVSLYDGLDFQILKKSIVYISVYIVIFIWIKETIDYFVYKKSDIEKIYIPMTIILLYLGTSFLSATLEEVYAVLFIPIIIIYFLEFAAKKNIEKYGVVIFCFALCFCCLSQKLYIPYDWHEWRIPSMLVKENNVQESDIDGLEGFYLSEGDELSYQGIIQSILNNSTDEDVMFQFSSIPLFNLLAERKSVYVAIPYFDVCPDDLAISAAEELKANLPKLVLFDELSEWRWVLHEEVFRNSNLSGQREILNFYTDYVKRFYRLLGTYNNNVGENVCLWKRTAYNGGVANGIIGIDSEKEVKQKLRFMQNEFDTIAIQKIIQEDLMGDKFRFVLKNVNTGEVVMDRTVIISEIEDNYYVCKVGIQEVDVKADYELIISYAGKGECYLGVCSDIENKLPMSVNNQKSSCSLSVILD